MKVLIKNKFFSVGGSSSVKDENGNDAFYVKGRVFSPTKVKWVCDGNGNKLYKVRNKWFNFFTHKAYVYADGEKVATVKHPPFSGKKFVVSGYDGDITVNGDFFSLKSYIECNGKVIGTINRQITVVNDAFSLEADEKDMPFLIALVIAIDNIMDKIMKSNS